MDLPPKPSSPVYRAGAPAYEVPEPLMPWYKNPGLWIGLLTPVAAILNQRFGLKLTPEEIGVLASGVIPTVIGLFAQHVKHNDSAMQAQARMDAARAYASHGSANGVSRGG